MADQEFMYKGKSIVIRDEHPDAVVSVDGREFRCHHHQPEEGQGLAMWMCAEAYFASPDIRELARHFADYGYMFDDPGRIIVDADGEVVDRGSGSRRGQAAGDGHRASQADRRQVLAERGPGGHRRIPNAAALRLGGQLRRTHHDGRRRARPAAVPGVPPGRPRHRIPPSGGHRPPLVTRPAPSARVWAPVARP